MMKVQIKIRNNYYESVVDSIIESVKGMQGVSSIIPEQDAKFYSFEVVFEENVADFERILKKVQASQDYSRGLKIKYKDLEKV